MTQNVDPKILAKIKKCLALAQSSEPHEAAAALRQAQKLMAAHGVSEAETVAADIGVAEADGYTISNTRRWENVLLGTVTRAFGCRVVAVLGNSDLRRLMRYRFIGLKAQAEVAAYTFSVLYRQCLRARTEYLRPYAGEPRGWLAKQGDDFCLGWAHGVYRTVQDFALEPQVAEAISKRADEEATGGAHDIKDKDRAVSAAAVVAGQEAARDARLYRPMEGQKQQRLGAK